MRTLYGNQSEKGTAPMMIVLSLSVAWEVSIEGIVPDMDRARDMVGDVEEE